jgi:hypothetical protein
MNVAGCANRGLLPESSCLDRIKPSEPPIPDSRSPIPDPRSRSPIPDPRSPIPGL